MFPTFTDSIGNPRRALGYNGANEEAIRDLIASTGAQHAVIVKGAYVNGLPVPEADVSIQRADGYTSSFTLSLGDWIVECSCPSGFHRWDDAAFTKEFTSSMPDPFTAPSLESANTEPRLYRDGLGVVSALMYDGRNTQAISDWLTASGEQGRIEECIDPADPLNFFKPYILVITIDGMEPLFLRPGDWLIKCDCSYRFHACPADAFAHKFLAVDENGRAASTGSYLARLMEAVTGMAWDVLPEQDEPSPEPQDLQEAAPVLDSYQRTNAQVIEDLQSWSAQNIGHYGNEKPQDVLRRAYSDALELALYLREQIDFRDELLAHM